MKGVVTEAEVLDNSRCPPAAGIQTVRLPHTLGREVVEVVLHQLVEVVAEEDLELALELVVPVCLDLADGAGGEDLGGGLPDDPGAVVVSWNNAD